MIPYRIGINNNTCSPMHVVSRIEFTEIETRVGCLCADRRVGLRLQVKGVEAILALFPMF